MRLSGCQDVQMQAFLYGNTLEMPIRSRAVAPSEFHLGNHPGVL